MSNVSGQSCIDFSKKKNLFKEPMSVNSVPICFVSTSIIFASRLQYVAPTLKFHKTLPVAAEIIATTVLQK